MSYTRAIRVNPRLDKGFSHLQSAFEKLNVKLDTPSLDGFLRHVLLPDGREVVFSADALPLNRASSQFLARDKLSTYQLLTQAGIAVPKGIAFFTRDFYGHKTEVEPHLLIENVMEALPQYFNNKDDPNFKVIVKPGRESQGVGVKVCRTFRGIEQHAQNVILKMGRYGLVQEYVEIPEYRVAILDDKILTIYQKPPRRIEGDEDCCMPISDRALESSASKPVLLQEADVPYEVKLTARQAHSVLGLRYSGVDVCLPFGVPPAIVLEVNANPGFDFLDSCHPQIAQETADKVARAVLESFVP